MRYIITQSQFHSLIYNYLNSMFSKKDFRKQIGYHFMEDNNWNIEMFDDNGENLISYIWYGPGEYDDGTPHNGIGTLLVNPYIVDTLRKIFAIRESKVLDIIADWVSETLNVDVDDIGVYPERKILAVY